MKDYKSYAMLAVGVAWTLLGLFTGDHVAYAAASVWLVGAILYSRMGDR
jgi:hypothetical protein